MNGDIGYPGSYYFTEAHTYAADHIIAIDYLPAGNQPVTMLVFNFGKSLSYIAFINANCVNIVLKCYHIFMR